MDSSPSKQSLPNPSTIQQAKARYFLGLLDIEDLPTVCTALLEDPVDDQLLAVGVTHGTDIQSILGAWHQLNKTHGLLDMSESEAIEIFVNEICCFIVDGRVTAVEGAHFITRVVAGHVLQHDHKYDTFIYASSEASERADHGSILERAVQDEARAVVNLKGDR